MATNPIRFTGLSSGLDTESIVTAMVSNYKAKVDDSKRQEQLLEWKKDAYKEVSSKIYNFYTKSMNTLRLESTFNKKKISATTNSAIELDSNSTISSGTHTIDKITQLAEGARIPTQKLKYADSASEEVKKQEIGLTTKLSDLGFKNKDSITFSDSEGVSKTIMFCNREDIPEVAEKDTYYIQLNTDTDADSGIKTEAAEVKELQEVLGKVLPDSNAKFNATAGAFFITSKTTGKDEFITINASSNSVLEAMGIETSKVNTSDATDIKLDSSVDAKIIGFTISGKNAIYSYNGINGIESSSNNINIDGLKFTITDTTEKAITITSTEDVDAMVKVVKDFVDEYNTLISDLNEMLNADSAGSYKPLTDEEKESMSDTQIEKWEKKIKDSLLRNDSTLSGLLTSMRQTLNATVSGNEFKSLVGIGITTGSYTENGKLYVDEDKLKTAITKNSDALIQLLSGTGNPEALYLQDNPNKTSADYKALSSSDKSVYTSKTLGIFDRMYDTLKSKFNGISNVKSSTSLYNNFLWDKKITNQAEETSKWEERLTDKEEYYYSKFTAMEKLMSSMNSQTNSLTSLLGG